MSAFAIKLPDWRKWLRTAKATHQPAILSRRHIYILPTRFGWGFGLVLVGMLIGSINYSLSLGYILTFLLAGMGNVAMLHTWRNLANLHVQFQRAQPVFSGEEAFFEIELSEHQQRARYTIAAHFENVSPTFADMAPGEKLVMRLPHPSKQRGWLKPGRISFYTEFPLSLFHVWSYAALDCRCLIYPHPLSHSEPVPASSDEGSMGNLDTSSGDDDFAGHRNYQFGDSPKRVDWKASSREQGLLVKQFQGEGKSTLWLDWATTPGQNNEHRLQQLTRWIVDAHAAKQRYGLRVPGTEIPPNNTEPHYHQCLETLALLEP